MADTWHLGWFGPIGRSRTVVIPVTMLDTAGDQVTGVASPTIKLSKNGAAFGDPSDGTWAEVGNGLYTVQLDGTDTGALGWIYVRILKSGVTAEMHFVIEVANSPQARAQMATYISRINRRIVR